MCSLVVGFINDVSAHSWILYRGIEHTILFLKSQLHFHARALMPKHWKKKVLCSSDGAANFIFHTWRSWLIGRSNRLIKAKVAWNHFLYCDWLLIARLKWTRLALSVAHTMPGSPLSRSVPTFITVQQLKEVQPHETTFKSSRTKLYTLIGMQVSFSSVGILWKCESAMSKSCNVEESDL